MRDLIRRLVFLFLHNGCAIAAALTGDFRFRNLTYFFAGSMVAAAFAQLAERPHEARHWFFAGLWNTVYVGTAFVLAAYGFIWCALAWALFIVAKTARDQVSLSKGGPKGPAEAAKTNTEISHE